MIISSVSVRFGQHPPSLWGIEATADPFVCLSQSAEWWLGGIGEGWLEYVEFPANGRVKEADRNVA